MSTTVSTAQPAPSATWGNAVFVDGHVAWVHFNETGKHWWEGDGWNMQAQQLIGHGDFGGGGEVTI